MVMIVMMICDLTPFPAGYVHTLVFCCLAGVIVILTKTANGHPYGNSGDD
jgi:hypothetical protein